MEHETPYIKGGRNSRPTTPRPAQPAGQGGHAWTTAFPTAPGFYWLYWAHPEEPELICAVLKREFYAPATAPLDIHLPDYDYELTPECLLRHGGALYWMPISGVPAPPLLKQKEV